MSVSTSFLKARLTQTCLLSCRVSCCGPPTAFLRRSTGVHWVSLPGPTSAPHSPRCLCGKAPTLLGVVVGVVGVVTSCALCVRVPRSCATENTDTRARLEALFKLSVVAILRHLYQSLQHVFVLSPSRHLVRHVLHLVRSLFACCTQCPWISLNPSRLRDTRCTSCQLCCEHFEIVRWSVSMTSTISASDWLKFFASLIFSLWLVNLLSELCLLISCALLLRLSVCAGILC